MNDNINVMTGRKGDRLYCLTQGISSSEKLSVPEANSNYLYITDILLFYKRSKFDEGCFVKAI